MITIEGLRNVLNPLGRRRYIVFCHEDDLADVAEVCRVLRSERYEIIEKRNNHLLPGTAYRVDADELQPGRLIGALPPFMRPEEETGDG